MQVSSLDGATATFVHGRCGQASQTPTTFANDGTTDVGYKVTMTATGTQINGILYYMHFDNILI